MSDWQCQMPAVSIDSSNCVRFEIPYGSVMTDAGFLRNSNAYTLITSDMLHKFRERVDAIDDFSKKMESME